MVNDIIAELLDLDMDQAGIAMRDEHASGRGQSDIESGEQWPRVGPLLQRCVRSLGTPFPPRWEGVTRSRSHVVQRLGQLVARQIHFLVKECIHANEMSESTQPRLQYCPKRQR